MAAVVMVVQKATIQVEISDLTADKSAQYIQTSIRLEVVAAG
jgi:hypothetical protein